MSTSVGQRLLDRGYDRGRQEGLEQAILRVLTRRFGTVPPSTDQQIAGIQERQRLEALLDLAVSASSLDEFTQALG